AILRRADGTGHEIPEAGPARAAVELGIGRKERRIAAGAMIKPGPLLIIEGRCEGPLRALPPQDLEGLRRQARAPFIVAELDCEMSFDCLCTSRPRKGCKRRYQANCSARNPY